MNFLKYIIVGLILLLPIDIEAKELDVKYQKRLEQSVFKLLVKGKGDKYYSGTAFVFDRSGYLMTCQHVVRDQEEIFIAFEVEGSDHWIKAELVLNGDDSVDIAIIKVNFTFDAFLPISKVNPKNQDSLWVLGFPGSSAESVSKTGKLLFSEVLMGPGACVNGLCRMPIINGMSGSPVINEKGEVVGVANAGMAKSMKNGFYQVSYFVNLTGINKMLKKLEEQNAVRKTRHENQNQTGMLSGYRNSR